MSLERHDMTHDGDDVFDDDGPDTLRDTVKTTSSVNRDDDETGTLRDTVETTSPVIRDHDEADTLRGMVELTAPLGPEDDDFKELSDTVELNLPSALAYTNIVFDDALLDHDEDVTKEERQSIDAAIAGLRAALVFRDDELAFVELEWSPESGLVFPASDEMVDAVHLKAAHMGYPISLLLRRALAVPDKSTLIERHIVIFHPEPTLGDGTRVSIDLQLGLDLDDEDYGRPAQAELLRDQWVERATELVKLAYPRAQLNTMICDHDADEVRVSTPLGIDPTDFEWRIDDLIEQATDEIIENGS